MAGPGRASLDHLLTRYVSSPLASGEPQYRTENQIASRQAVRDFSRR